MRIGTFGDIRIEMQDKKAANFDDESWLLHIIYVDF